MAKGPTGADAIMSVAAIKQLLAKARRGDPVNCAIGISKDKEPLVLLDRKKKPRKLMGDLKKKAADAGMEVAAPMLRFGRAEIDGSEDARTVTFVVNKEAPGMYRALLTKLLRPAGVGHVEITVDEKIDTESDEDEAPGEDPSAPAPAPAATEAPAPANGAMPPDADPAQAAAPPPGADQALATIGKSSLVWDATRKHVEKQLGDLHKAMTEAYKGHGFGAELDKVFHSTVEPIITGFDDTLSHKLMEVSRTTDAAARGPLLDEARQIIVRYETYLAGEPLLAKLDANPFIPMTIAKTLTASLEALNRSLASAAGKLGH